MTTLSWELFDGLRFQKLCNALLLIEVSKFAQVYSAPGKDGGIDQLFQGTYNGKSGNWRFQDKFHHSGNTTKDISAFKADVVSDIKDHWAGEDYLVFLTNVRLPVAKEKELLGAARDALTKLGVDKCEVYLWHRDWIDGVLVTHPLIYSWFWEKDSLLLEPYETFFEKQLNASVHSQWFQQFHNKFVGRADDLQDLSNFLSQDTVSTIALVANGGYGKTRLCLEFFKKVIDPNNEWVPLVLSPSAFNPTHFKHLLEGSRRFLILLDNANEVPEILAEVKRIVDNTGGRCKLILTTRKALLSNALGKLPTIINDVHVKEIYKLTRPETKAFIENELPWLNGQQTAYLTDLSKGIPNLILEISQAVHDGTQPFELSADNFFSDNVKKLVDEVAVDVERVTTITRQYTWETIHLLSLISPAKDNEGTKAFIASMTGLAPYRVEQLITQLEASGILSRYGGLSIKPDPYSDAILVDTMTSNKEFINHVRNHAGSAAYFENILKNLAEANMAQGEKDFFVDTLLRDYIDQLASAEITAAKFKSIIELANDIRVIKPELAIKAVGYFLVIYSNQAHPFQNQSGSNFSRKTVIEEAKEIIEKILAFVVGNTEYALDKLPTLHELIEQYATTTGNFDIVPSCYGYGFGDIKHKRYGNPRKCCEKQLFLKDIVCWYFRKEEADFKLKIAIAGARTLFGTETIRETYFEEATMSFHIEQGAVPACQHVLEIRGDVIDAMLRFLQRDAKEETKATVLEQLLELITYCIGESGKVVQISAATIDKMLQFLDSWLDNNPTIYQRNEILYRLRFYKRRDVKKKYLERLKALEAKAENVTTRYEKLALFLLSKGSFEREPKFEPTFKKLLSEYGSVDAFLKDLLKIRLQNGDFSFGNYTQTLNYLAARYTDDVKGFYEQIKLEQPELIHEFATLIRYSHINEDYFYGEIDYLRDRFSNYDSTIIWLLLHGRMDIKAKQSRDLNYIQPIIERGENHSIRSLSGHLWEYADLDKERTFYLIQLLFEKCTQHQHEESMFLRSLVHSEAAFATSFSREIKDFLFHNTNKLPLANHYGDWILSFLEHHFGFDTMLDYAVTKVRLELKGDEYKYLALGDHIYRDNTTSGIDPNQRYLRIVQWYLNCKEEEKVADYIARLFMPPSGYNEALSTHILSIKNAFYQNEDVAGLKKLAKAVGAFVPTQSQIVSCLCEIAEAVLSLKAHSSDVYDIFSYYHRAGGGKSKSGYGPYPQDVLKKQALEETQKSKQWSPSTVEFLKKQLRYVQDEIDREVERENYYRDLDW